MITSIAGAGRPARCLCQLTPAFHLPITSGSSEHQYPNRIRAAVLTPGQFYRGGEDAAGHGSDKLPDCFI
jgi:hypothetical protein